MALVLCQRSLFSLSAQSEIAFGKQRNRVETRLSNAKGVNLYAANRSLLAVQNRTRIFQLNPAFVWQVVRWQEDDIIPRRISLENQRPVGRKG